MLARRGEGCSELSQLMWCENSQPGTLWEHQRAGGCLRNKAHEISQLCYHALKGKQVSALQTRTPGQP